MFISKITNLSYIENIYSEHQLIWQFFPSQPERQFLYRRELINNRPSYIVVSNVQPTIPINIANDTVILESKQYNPTIYDDQRFSFTIRVNPIKETKSNRKRHDVVMYAIKNHYNLYNYKPNRQVIIQESVSNWLKHHQNKNGFEIIENSICVDEYFQHQLFSKTNEKIQFSTCNISGQLIITDDDKFKKMLYNGIGKSKGFGCGLMLIKPVTPSSIKLEHEKRL